MPHGWNDDGGGDMGAMQAGSSLDGTSTPKLSSSSSSWVWSPSTQGDGGGSGGPDAVDVMHRCLVL